MVDKAKHTDPKDKSKFAQGDKEAPRKGVGAAKDTAKTREAKRSKGGRRERETK